MKAGTAPAHDFKTTAAAALAAADAVLSHWLPDGKHNGHEYQALNPTRTDSRPGSFSINTSTGQWADFATDDNGGDLIALVAYLDGCNQGEAESRLAEFLGLHSKNCVTCVTSVTPKHNGKKNSALDTAGPVTQPESAARNTRNTPPPADAPAPNFTHRTHGKPAAVWTYHTAEGRPLLLCMPIRYSRRKANPAAKLERHRLAMERRTGTATAVQPAHPDGQAGRAGTDNRRRKGSRRGRCAVS